MKLEVSFRYLISILLAGKVRGLYVRNLRDI